MARRKHKKFIDPRYFLNETADRDLDEVLGLFGDSKLEKLYNKYLKMFTDNAKKGTVMNNLVPQSFSMYGNTVNTGKLAQAVDVAGAPPERIEKLVSFLAKATAAGEKNKEALSKRKGPLQIDSAELAAYKYFFNSDRDSGSWARDKQKSAEDAEYQKGAPARSKARKAAGAAKLQKLLDVLPQWWNIRRNFNNRAAMARELTRNGAAGADLEKSYYYLKSANAALQAAKQLIRTPEGTAALKSAEGAYDDNGASMIQDIEQFIATLKQVGGDEENKRSAPIDVDDRDKRTDDYTGPTGQRQRASNFQRTSRFNESKLFENWNNFLKEHAISEGIKDYIKSGAINSAIPAGSLVNTLSKNPELSQQARDASDPQGQEQAFQKIAQLLAQDPDIVRAIGDDPIERHLDVVGLLRYAEQNMPQVW